MAHYNGPKGRVNRRLGVMVYESSGAQRALDRRNYPPGMHTRRGKPSTYGLGLNEKQKIKHYYGLGERQLRRYYDIAVRLPGNTGESMLLLCERRLDNVVRRVGLAHTRPQARQGVTHRHFQVNGVTVNKPSFLVRPGDVITVRERKNLHEIYQVVVDSGHTEPIGWANFDSEHLRATVTGYPSAVDISLPVDVQLVIEFMSR